jgi:hypothetical protein
LDEQGVEVGKRAEWLLEISKKGAELMEKMALGHQFENEDSE